MAFEPTLAAPVHGVALLLFPDVNEATVESMALTNQAIVRMRHLDVADDRSYHVCVERTTVFSRWSGSQERTWASGFGQQGTPSKVTVVLADFWEYWFLSTRTVGLTRKRRFLWPGLWPSWHIDTDYVLVVYL